MITRFVVFTAFAALPLVAPDFDVKTFGALADGKHVAIDRAIVAAQAAGGGTVRFPAGRYLSVTIHLQSNVALRFDPGAVIEAVTPAVQAFDAPEAVVLPRSSARSFPVY